MRIIIATIKPWNLREFEELKNRYKKVDFILISKEEELKYEKVNFISPDYIFFPHWSWKIPKDIYESFNCVVFHMTDLPFGRGGTPLQNLISRKIENTKISAIKVEEDIDAGDIYLKKELNLNGTAQEIFIRSSKVIFRCMIPKFIEEKIIVPKKQVGEPVVFKRLSKENSKIEETDLEEIYDKIRMLDAEGYPNAYIEFGKYKMKFSRASYKGDRIIADVEIMEE